MRIVTKYMHELEDGREIELAYCAEEGMIEIVPAADKIVVGYLVHDDDCENPLEDCDGYGKILSLHRHSSNMRDALEAMGLHRDGSPDVQAVWDRHGEAAIERYIDIVTKGYSLEELVENYSGDYERDEGESDTDFVVSAMRLECDDAGDNWQNVSYDSLMGGVLESMWSEPEYFPGNKDGVTLDCYEHGGQHWSITGGGMQCRWDTARGAGIWVPDECAAEEIARRTVVYASGKVEMLKKHYVAITNDGVSGPQFERWSDAFDWLAKNPVLTPDFELGHERAKRELCQQALDQYNAWLAGDCWGWVIEVFDAETLEQCSEEACWQYVGGEYAKEELDDQVKWFVEDAIENYRKDVHTQCGKQQELGL